MNVILMLSCCRLYKNVKLSKKRETMKLYHYCSYEKFKSILQSKTLWLTQIVKSNDTRKDHIANMILSKKPKIVGVLQKVVIFSF